MDKDHIYYNRRIRPSRRIGWNLASRARCIASQGRYCIEENLIDLFFLSNPYGQYELSLGVSPSPHCGTVCECMHGGDVSLQT